MRTETDAILDAMSEAFRIGRASESPVIISHLKCAGIANWGRSGEVLHALEAARNTQRSWLRLLSLRCWIQHARSAARSTRASRSLSRGARPIPEMAGRTLAESLPNGTLLNSTLRDDCSLRAQSITALMNRTCGASSLIPPR